MALFFDSRFRRDCGCYFGPYVGFYVSPSGKVHAHLFSKDKTVVTAYVVLPAADCRRDICDGWRSELYGIACGMKRGLRLQLAYR